MAVLLKRGPKKGSRSNYNIYMKNTTPIIRNEYENITKTRSEQNCRNIGNVRKRRME